MDDSLQFKREKVQESKGSKVNVPVPVNVHKDLRGVLCPMNFVKTKLELATMQSGDVLEIWLDDGKPIENVPGSVKLEGHEILSQTQHTDGYWQVLIKKK
jgi:sulfite reductase (ferredoxin)